MDYPVCKNANFAFFVKGGYKGSQGVTRGYRRIQGITWFFSRKKLNSDSLDFLCSGLEGVTGGYKGLQGVTRGN